MDTPIRDLLSTCSGWKVTLETNHAHHEGVVVGIDGSGRYLRVKNSQGWPQGQPRSRTNVGNNVWLLPPETAKVEEKSKQIIVTWQERKEGKTLDFTLTVTRR